PCAILLDLKLPDGTGWSTLDRLKHDPATRHIPVDIVSVEEDYLRGLRLGALNYLTKPVARDELVKALDNTKAFLNRPVRNLLLVTSRPAQRRDVAELIGSGDVQITAVATAQEAAQAQADTIFDCIVLDLDLPDLSAMKLLQKMRPQPTQADLPVVLYSDRKLTRKEAAELKKVPSKVLLMEAPGPEALF